MSIDWWKFFSPPLQSWKWYFTYIKENSNGLFEIASWPFLFFYWYPLLISPIPRNSAHMETPVLQCWKTVLPNDRRNFFRDEDDRLLILILVASFIIISMIVIIGVVRFFSYCILSLLLSLSSLLGGQLRSSLLWGRSLLFWCRVTGVKVKAVTPKLYNDVAHPWFKLQKWKSWIQER